MGARIDSPIARVPSSRSPDTFSLYSSEMPPRGRGGSAPPRSTHRGRGAPQQSTCANGLRFSRVVVGQAATSCGARSRDLSLTYHTRGCLGRVLAPIDRRRGAEEEGGVRPRRRRCRREPAPGRLRQGARGKTEVSTAPAVATCRVQAACLSLDPTDSTDPSPRNTRHSSPPHPPPASVRARAAGPRLGRAPHACESSVQGADNVAYGGLRGQLRDSGRSRVAIG